MKTLRKQLAKRYLEKKYPVIVQDNDDPAQPTGLVLGSLGGKRIHAAGNSGIVAFARSMQFHPYLIHGPEVDQAIRMGSSVIILDDAEGASEFRNLAEKLDAAGYDIQILNLADWDKVAPVIEEKNRFLKKKASVVGFDALGSLKRVCGQGGTSSLGDIAPGAWALAKDLYQNDTRNEIFDLGGK